MNEWKAMPWAIVVLSAWWAGVTAHSQPPMGGRGGPDVAHRADMEIFHYLLDRGKDIRRTITKLDNGVETLTESDDAKLVEKIQAHVAAMKKRVEEQRPIHMRDPLFAALFRNAGKIEFTLQNTARGVKVRETSRDPYVVKLVQAHAEVVSLFLKNGRAEAMKNHDVPKP